MSVIESAVAPHVTPLILGQPHLLDTFGQRMLATFLCLVAIRFGFITHPPIAVPKAERDWLRLQHEPPSNWSIWIARYTDENPEEQWARAYGMQGGTSPIAPEKIGLGYCNTYVATLVTGKLCAHVFRSTLWTEFGGYEGIHLTRVWPQRKFDIDSRFLPPVDEKALLWLHEAMARETPHVVR
jgi:hypothetical protein